MEIDQIETFLAVGAVGGWGEWWGGSNPAVSARIKALEASLGVRLFERGRDGLVLSPAGRAFKPHAEEILRAVAHARQAVHAVTPVSGGALEIAVASHILNLPLPCAL